MNFPNNHPYKDIGMYLALSFYESTYKKCLREE